MKLVFLFILVFYVKLTYAGSIAKRRYDTQLIDLPRGKQKNEAQKVKSTFPWNKNKKGNPGDANNNNINGNPGFPGNTDDNDENENDEILNFKEQEKDVEIMNPTTEPVWIFDGVDYDTTSWPLKEDVNDCIGVHIDCILNNSHLRPVCASNINLSGKRESVYSKCELDYRNCNQRVDRKEGELGATYFDDYLEMVDEGYNCIELRGKN